MNFSCDSLHILSSYLKDRKQYVQFEDKILSIKLNKMFFGVPQGSIFGSVLFNLYVVELSDQVTSTSIQSDNRTFYRHCKLKDL